MEKNFFLLIFISTLLFSDTEFIFSHKFSVKNEIVVCDDIYISKAMTLTKSKTIKLCTIKKKRKKRENIISYLRRNKNKLIKCFQKKGKEINSFYENDNQNSYSYITVKTIPIRFTVNFNHDFAIISIFNNK